MRKNRQSKTNNTKETNKNQKDYLEESVGKGNWFQVCQTILIPKTNFAEEPILASFL